MLPASMLLDLKHPTYAYVLVMDLACDNIYGTLLNNTGQRIFPKLRPEITIFLDLRAEVKVGYATLSDPKMLRI